jgi:hypothetical protein
MSEKMTPEEREGRKALHCLYIAVEASIADDVKTKVEAWVAAAEQVAREDEREISAQRLEELAGAIRTGDKR